MASHSRKSSKKAGLMPGSVVYIGEIREGKASVRVIDYDETDLKDQVLSEIEECFPLKESPTVSWINIDGVHDTGAIEKIGKHFEIHPLILEDIANTNQRPKYEDQGNFVFVVARMLSSKGEERSIESEQISIIFGENFLISFQEKEGDIFDPVRERIRKQVPRTRFMGTDYLAYALLDAVVDNYYIILENLGEQIEALQDRLVANPERQDLETIHKLKRELTRLRRSIWPLREVVSGLDRIDSPLLHSFTHPYLRDLYDHVVQVIDSVETYREMVSGLLDIYLSSVSNRMNEVMKVLTIIATIFIPLGFLAGIYGMNFDTSISRFNMPELGWRFGYLFFWTLALAIAGGLIYLFRRKKWL